jgi:hypothetical protein
MAGRTGGRRRWRCRSRWPTPGNSRSSAGAAPAGLASQAGSRAASGLRPGPLRVPARSSLMRAGGAQAPGETHDRLRKARPGAGVRTPRRSARRRSALLSKGAPYPKGRQPYPKGPAVGGAARRSTPSHCEGTEREEGVPRADTTTGVAEHCLMNQSVSKYPGNAGGGTLLASAGAC